MVRGKRSKTEFEVVFIPCLAAIIQITLAARSHVVGDSKGWSNESTAAPESFYSAWAAQQSFRVGDVLVFNFQSGKYTVAEVSKSEYDSCTATMTISLELSGPANLTITTSGNHYYICIYRHHCTAGLKLAITALDNTAWWDQHHDPIFLCMD